MLAVLGGLADVERDLTGFAPLLRGEGGGIKEMKPATATRQAFH